MMGVCSTCHAIRYCSLLLQHDKRLHKPLCVAAGTTIIRDQVNSDVRGVGQVPGQNNDRQMEGFRL